MLSRTFEVKSFVPLWIESLPFNLGLKPVLLVWEQRHPDIRVTEAVSITRLQVLAL